MIDIYSTNDLIEVVRRVETPGSFLKGYFPTGPRDNSTKRARVIIERKEGENSAAPFVVPYKGSKLVERMGYFAEEAQPAFINPALGLTIDELLKKGIGETEYDDVSPDQRAINYLSDDMADLMNRVNITKEYMRGQILCNGKVDVKVEGGDRFQMRFYDGNTFTNKRAITTGTGTLFSDIATAAAAINGAYGALDLILGADLVEPFYNDATVQKRLDIRNFNVGALSPADEVQGTATYHGTMNFNGKMLRVYSYTDTAMVDGEEVSFIDPKSFVVLPREKFGATKHGAVTQMEDDKQYHTYAGEMVPRVISDVASSTRRLEMVSACLPMPYMYDSWRVVTYTTI